MRRTGSSGRQLGGLNSCSSGLRIVNGTASELEVAYGAVGDQRHDLLDDGRVLRGRVVGLELVPALVVADEPVLPATARVLAPRRRHVRPRRPRAGRNGGVLEPIERVEDALTGAGRVRPHVPEEDVANHGATIDP